MTKQEQRAMERFVHFAIRYYVPNWFTAPIACSAPRRDLEYLQQLEKCEDNELALVALAFMDDEVRYLLR